MTHPPEVLAELEQNQAAYEAVKADMEAQHWGRTVLFNQGKIVAIYNDEGDAYAIGCEKFGLGKFSLQRVGERPVDLGFHTMSLVKGIENADVQSTR